MQKIIQRQNLKEIAQIQLIENNRRKGFNQRKIFIHEKKINQNFCSLCPVNYQNQVKLYKVQSGKNKGLIRSESAKNIGGKKSLKRNKSQLLNFSSPKNNFAANLDHSLQWNSKMIYSLNVCRKVQIFNKESSLLNKSIRAYQYGRMGAGEKCIKFTQNNLIKSYNISQNLRQDNQSTQKFCYIPQRQLNRKQNEYHKFMLDQNREIQTKQFLKKQTFGLEIMLKEQQQNLNILNTPPALKKSQTETEQDNSYQQKLMESSVKSTRIKDNIQRITQKEDVQNDNLIRKGLNQRLIKTQLVINKTGKLDNFKLRKTVSLREKQQQQDQFSEVIVGNRKIGRYQIMSNIQENMQESQMTHLQNSIRKQ